MDHDERVVWLFGDVVEIEGLSWSIQIWVITHDFGESGWLEMMILWDDDELDYDDRVSWLLEDIDGYHRASVRAFTRFQMSRHDYVGWMPVFSIDHVRSWKRDVRGFGQMMGGHHFMSLFTLSPSHIELPVASPLSLTRAHSLFFHHLIYLLHRVGDPVVLACYVRIRHEFQTWHTYSGIIPHSSLWYFSLGHHSITILRCHISPLVIFVLCFFFHHFLLDIIFVPPWVVVSHTSLHGGLSRFFPSFTLWAVV